VPSPNSQTESINHITNTRAQSYAYVTGNITTQSKTTDAPSAKMLSTFLDKFKSVINSLIAMFANIISKTG